MEDTLEEDRGHKAAQCSVREAELRLRILQDRLGCLCFAHIVPEGRIASTSYKNDTKSKSM